VANGRRTFVATAVEQTQDDSPTASFDLVFPVDLSAKQVTAWVYSLAGLLTSGAGRLFGVLSFTLELLVTDRGLNYRLVAPKAYAPYLANRGGRLGWNGLPGGFPWASGGGMLSAWEGGM
jgi:hypothetical protein